MVGLIVLGNKPEVESEVNRGKKWDHYWLTLLLHVSGEFLLEFNFSITKKLQLSPMLNAKKAKYFFFHL